MPYRYSRLDAEETLASHVANGGLIDEGMGRAGFCGGRNVIEDDADITGSAGHAGQHARGTGGTNGVRGESGGQSRAIQVIFYR
jgi:hypothetical protein